MRLSWLWLGVPSILTFGVVAACGDSSEGGAPPADDAGTPPPPPPADAAPADAGVPPPGDGGPVLALRKASSEYAVQILQQPDGKIVVVANHLEHSSAAAIRIDGKGVLDATFGEGGRAVYMSPFAYDAALGPDGKIAVSGSGTCTRIGADGKFDRTFAAPAGYQDGIAVQPDGKVIGASWNASTSAMRTQRFTTTGALDATFGTGGTVETPFGAGKAVAHAVMLQSTGAIVVASQYDTTPKAQFGIARYTTAGALDTSFGTAGLVVTTFAENARARRLFRLPNDGFVALGTLQADDYSPVGFAVARFDADGAPDGTFGTGGELVHVTGANAEGYAAGLGVRADGRVVVGVEKAIYQLKADGEPDPTFGTAGRVALSLPKAVEQGALLLAADGSIYGAGSIPGAKNLERTLSVWHYDATGQLDTTFGTGGQLVVPFEATRDEYRHATVLPDGKIVASGFGGHAGLVARYLPSGQLDTTFGDKGLALHGEEQLWAVTPDVTGKLYVINGFGVERLDTAGQKDATFAFSVSGGDSWFSTQAMAVDPARNALVVTGFAGGSKSEFLSVARVTEFGDGDGTFGTNGNWHRNVSGERGYAVVVQLDGKVVVAGGSDGGNGYTKQDLFFARLDAAGQLDPTFSGPSGSAGGFVTLDATPDPFEAVLAADLQTDGKIVLAGATGSGTYDGFYYDFFAQPTHHVLLARLGQNGVPDPTFGTNGIVSGDAIPGEARAVRVLSDGKILVAGRRRVTANDKVEMVAWRFTSTGALDTSFGQGGTYVATFGDDAAAHGLAVGLDGAVYFAGYATQTLTGHDLALLRLP